MAAQKREKRGNRYDIHPDAGPGKEKKPTNVPEGVRMREKKRWKL